MNKEQTLELIENIEKTDSEYGYSTGYFVVSINNEDIDTYANADVKKLFSKLSKDGKKKLLNILADEMGEYFEQHPRFGTGDLMRLTLSDEDVMNELNDIPKETEA